MSSYPRIASFRDAQAFAEHVKSLGADLPIDEEIIPGSDSPMAAPLVIADGRSAIVGAYTRWKDGMARLTGIRAS